MKRGLSECPGWCWEWSIGGYCCGRWWWKWRKICLFTSIITVSGVSERGRKMEADTASWQTAINPHISSSQHRTVHGTKTVCWWIYMSVTLFLTFLTSLYLPQLVLFSLLWHFAAVFDHGSGSIRSSSMSKSVEQRSASSHTMWSRLMARVEVIELSSQSRWTWTSVSRR